MQRIYKYAEVAAYVRTGCIVCAEIVFFQLDTDIRTLLQR